MGQSGKATAEEGVDAALGKRCTAMLEEPQAYKMRRWAEQQHRQQQQHEQGQGQGQEEEGTGLEGVWDTTIGRVPLALSASSFLGFVVTGACSRDADPDDDNDLQKPS